MMFRAKKTSLKVVALIVLFTMVSSTTLYGVESTKDYVDWPIDVSSGDRTPALLPRADQDSIQFHASTGFDIGVMGSNAWKSRKYQCTSPFDKRCVEERVLLLPSKRWKSTNQLPICASPQESTLCIEKILISEQNGEKYLLTPSGTIPGYQWPANKTYGSPAGALTSTWSSGKDRQGSGYTLSAQVDVQGFYDKYETEILQFRTTFFRYELTPLKDPYLIANQRTFCLWIDQSSSETKCARQKFLDLNSLITVTYHLPKELTGWFAGRLKDATLTIKSIDSDFNSVTVSAYPTEVPVFAATIPCDKEKGPCGVGAMTGFTGIPKEEYIQSLQKILKDKAILEIPSWGLRTTSTGQIRYERGCKVPSQGFAGLVFSNATFAYTFPPKFENETLRYEMGALHLKSDGSVFKGNFDMFIESNFARCLWRLSKEPVQASISVISKDGVQNVATTSLGERDGFIRMKAAGFTFSTSTVEMKLQNVKPTKINCLRASNKKVFTVSGNVCPKGSSKVAP